MLVLLHVKLYNYSHVMMMIPQSYAISLALIDLLIAIFPPFRVNVFLMTMISIEM